MSRSPYLALEARIAADERGGVLHRWRYGRRLVEAKGDRKQLPHGLAADLVKAAEKAGLKLSEREVRYRLQCAEAYRSEAEVGTAVQTFGSWTDLREAGFPPVQSDLLDLLDPLPHEISTAAPDEFEQLTLIPGLAKVLSVGDRKIPLDEATVGDARAYREQYRQIHANFGKTLALIEESVDAMIEGSGGDDYANAVEAWKRATEGDDPDGPAGDDS